ncbi:hypothetical protein NEOKW01_1971 [Nematocida sp. AWRm80]|nr:hypothetical protein NEOKW01_1971 [Nematocida sp. AWRm80]
MNAYFNGFEEDLTLLKRSDDGFSEDTLPRKILCIAWGLLGLEMSILGKKRKIINLAIVLLLYGYQYLLKTVDLVCTKLYELNNDTYIKLVDFITKTWMHKFVIVLALSLLVAAILLGLASLFLKACLFVLAMFLGFAGPVQGMFVSVGLDSVIAGLVVGVLLGILFVWIFEKKIKNYIFMVLFSVVGSSLIIYTIGYIVDKPTVISDSLLTLNKPATSWNHVLIELIILFISITASIAMQASIK